MLVLFHIFLAFVVVYACGFGLVGILHTLFGNRGQAVGVGVIVPVAGYAVSQLAFSLFYRWLINSNIAVIAVGIVAAILALVYIIISRFSLQRWRSSFSSLLPFRSDRALVVPLIAVLALSSWVYIAIGEGHYFHSGNEDFFDGITGGEAYLMNTPLKELAPEFKGDIQLQYTSQAYWCIVLGIGGMDAFALQSILNLLLTIISIYWLVRYVFDGSSRLSALLAFCCVTANFYFTTYLAGHIGSMMYLSVAPVLLGLLLAWGQRKLGLGWLLLAVLFYGFISITYPGPFNFLLVPLVFLLVHERLFKPWNLWQRIGEVIGVKLISGKGIQIQWRHLWKFSILLLFGALAAVELIDWIRLFMQDMKMYAALQLRTATSWRIAFEKEILVIFWGLIPSNLVGSVSFFPFFLTNLHLSAAMFVAALIIWALSFFAAWTHRLKMERQYLPILVFLFPAFYVMMVEFWGSPYYAYKFLYTNFFVVVIALGIWISDRTSSLLTWKKTLWLIAPICLIGINLFWNLSRSINILDRPYHQKEKIADFLSHVGKESIRDYAIDIPDETNTNVFDYLFFRSRRSQGPVRSNAKYLIQLENLKTVAYTTLSRDSVLYSNGLLRLVKRPEVNDIVMNTKYGIDHFSPWRITWVGNEVTGLNMWFGGLIKEAVDFIKSSGNQDRIYLDMRSPHIYWLLDRALTKERITLQIDPMKSSWFLRQKFTRFTYAWDRIGQTVFQETPNERVVFKNKFLEIVEVPRGEHQISSVVSENVERTTFVEMIQLIRRMGNRVHIDMPPYELATLWVEQYLHTMGVAVVDSPHVTLILRLSAPDNEMYSYKSFIHPQEQILWQSKWETSRQKVSVGLQLVNVPTEGRINMETSHLDSLRYWYLLSGGAFDFEVSLSNLSLRAKYLRVLVTPGPGIDFSDFNLLLRASDQHILRQWPVSGATTCIDIPLNDSVLTSRKTSMLNFEGEDLLGHSLMPADERLLNYGVLAVELTDCVDKYSDEMLAALNPRVKLQYSLIESKIGSSTKYNDIIDELSKANLWLGTGWYAYETQAGRPFRWVNNGAQFVLRNPTAGTRYLNVEIEKGPSLAVDEPTMQVIQDGEMIDHFLFVGRCKRKVRLNKTSADQSFIMLQVNKVGHRIPEDPRKLDFRVFRAYLSSH